MDDEEEKQTKIWGRKNFSFVVLLFFLIILIASSNIIFLSCSKDNPEPTPTPTATATVTNTPTPTPTPAPRIEPIISGIEPGHYNIQRMDTGVECYIDSQAQITELPSYLVGSQGIIVALADERIETYPFIRFTVDRPIIVYIAYDLEAENRPNWLQPFEELDGQKVVVGSPVSRTYRLLKLPFAPGIIKLGGNYSWGTEGDVRSYLIFITGFSGDYQFPGPRRLTYLDHEGYLRTWFCQFPPHYNPSGMTPLLFYFQGSQGSYDYIGKTIESTGLMDKCLERNIILVAPEIYDWIWLGTANGDHDYTDAVFVNDIIEFSDNSFPHHAEKVYATGFSSGAFFTNLVALLPPRTFAAIAPFSGGIPNNSSIWPEPGDPIFRVLFLVGSWDTDDIHDAVQLGFNAYQSAGYPVEMEVIPYWTHNWYVPMDDRILDFFLVD